MKAKFAFLFISVFLVAIFAVTPSAEAARGCAFSDILRTPESFIETDDVPPGSTKYSGVLTVFYKDSDGSDLKDVHFFLRLIANVSQGGGNFAPSWHYSNGKYYLDGGKEILSFDYVAEEIPYSQPSTEEAIVEQQKAFANFLRYVVNPAIYFKENSTDEVEVTCTPWDPDASLPPVPGQEECPPIFLKSVDNVVEDMGMTGVTDMVILDLVIARDK